jgi:hypothetical protein
MAAAALCFAVAGLTVTASLWTLYYIRVVGPNSFGSVYQRVDGWGRILDSARTSGGPDLHETRYGITVSVAAALFVVTGLLLVAGRFKRHPRAERLANATARTLTLLATASTAAVGAVELLDERSKSDYYHSLVAQSGGFGGFGGTEHVVLGTSFWAMVGALALAVLATVTTHYATRTTAPQPAENAPSQQALQQMEPAPSQPTLNPPPYGAGGPLAGWPNPGESR